MALAIVSRTGYSKTSRENDLQTEDHAHNGERCHWWVWYLNTNLEGESLQIYGRSTYLVTTEILS